MFIYKEAFLENILIFLKFCATITMNNNLVWCRAIKNCIFIVFDIKRKTDNIVLTKE